MFGKQSSTPHEPDELMRVLTFAEVMRHAALDRRARHLAVLAQPKAAETQLTTAESETIGLIEGRIAARAARLQTGVAALRDEITVLGAAPLPDARFLRQRCIDGVTEIVASRVPAIRRCLETERSARALLTAWKDEHDVARPARYPKSRLVHFCWVPLVMGIEAILYASMLMTATPDGIAGAVGLGLAISGLTTVLGLLIGAVALRYLAAQSRLWRWSARMLLAVLTALLAFVLVGAAQYRELAASAAQVPGQTAVMAQVFDGWLSLTMHGVLLLLASLVGTGFAVWKGYTASDPIPGYETVDRAYREAREDVEYLRSDIKGSLAALRDHTIAPLLQQPRIAQIKAAQMRSDADGMRVLAQQIRVLDQQERGLCMRAIAEFRRINLATRADGVVPAYFSEPVGVAGSTIAVPDTLDASIEQAVSVSISDAKTTATFALHLTNMLDQTSDQATQIMAEVDRADPVRESATSTALRTNLNKAIAAPLPDEEPALTSGERLTTVADVAA